ncbi:MAG: hypothetical protein A3F70_02535 [Acidobacteria bacterium RIFCSPLOWO2_12_FULL_67_14]|nr:MAG: hypothetical protein A3H29_19530 [Acidobacteria bacterium RIFCSPLOWO2_02_FULL_67_21]OFW37054.1 MAG: hypothetical protein A3F70_02535 [Acidobacteria bacterium RIFCSPLOWO2_12_FULL_67_14]
MTLSALLLIATVLGAAPDAREAPRQAGQPRIVTVTATRFAFEPSEIEATEGEPLRIVVRSGDGLHGFEIRDFSVSREVPRGGEPVVIEFTPTRAGRFPILCSVYCGEGHADMRGALVVRARESGGAAPSAAPAQPAPIADDPDLDLSVEQPEFSLVTLPTTLRVPQFKSAFRITHRFGRPLGSGDFGDLVGDLFGLDSGAQIGLEYRFGVMRGLQAGMHRTSNKTISFFGQYSVVQQRGASPVGLGALVSIDGTNNFRDIYSPAVGVAVSRTFTRVGAVYVEPIWVHNSNPAPDQLGGDNDTFMVGLAGRLRVRPTVYLVGEMIPRVSGYDPGVTHGTFGIEKRAGGHLFQLNVSNGFGTTMGQLARGGLRNDDWYLGFNISRKFF